MNEKFQIFQGHTDEEMIAWGKGQNCLKTATRAKIQVLSNKFNMARIRQWNSDYVCKCIHLCYQ